MGKSIIILKRSFFDGSHREAINVSFKENDFCLDQLQVEFTTLFQLYMSNQEIWRDNEQLKALTNSLCCLLIAYYKQDYVQSDLQKYTEKRAELNSFIISKANKKTIHSFTEYVAEELKLLLSGCTSSFQSSSALRKYIGNLNAARSQWSYSRALANQAIIYVQNSGISEFFSRANEFLGSQPKSADILKMLNNSREPLVVLGIALYSMRFIINLLVLLKHIINAAESDNLSVSKVMKQELEKRSFIMVSDLVWGVVSILINYYNFCSIPLSAVPPIVISFLAFDILLFAIQWIFDKNKYNSRLQELQGQLVKATVLERTTILRQIDVLNDDWEAQCALYHINLLGANVLIITFATALCCSGPFALSILALFNMLGNAMYNTADEYKKYQQSHIALRREKSNGELLNDEHHQDLMKLLQSECKQASDAFWQTLGLNVGGTAFLMTAFVISWPLALGLTCAYIAYRVNESYHKQLNADSEAPQISHNVYRLFNSSLVAKDNAVTILHLQPDPPAITS